MRTPSKRSLRIISNTTAAALVGVLAAELVMLLIHRILIGEGVLVALTTGALFAFGALALWDRWRCRRWPQPFKLSAPPEVTEEVKIVELAESGDAASQRHFSESGKGTQSHAERQHRTTSNQDSNVSEPFSS